MHLRMLMRTAEVATLPGLQAVLAGTIRLWALSQRMGWCSIGAVAQRLGDMRSAAHFHLMMEEIGSAWPEPFCVSPPCSPRLSHDEAVFVAMVALAAEGDRPAFDRLLSDLLPGDERERLYISSSLLARRLDV